MNYGIIFIVFFIGLNEVINSDPEFSNQTLTTSFDISCDASESNLDIDNVTTVVVYQKPCNNNEVIFDSDILKKFEKLETVNVSHLGLESFDFIWQTKPNPKTKKIEIKQRVNITVFIASHNSFRVIPKKIFEYIPSLRVIDFSSNKIDTLESSNFEVDSVEFKSNLAVINCSDNRIKHVKHNVFSNLTDLQILDLTKNPLKRFDFKIFSDDMHLVDVLLPLELEELDASCSQSKDSMPICHFKGLDHQQSFENLVSFNASGNQMNVTKLLNKLGTNVLKLDLSKNFINEFKHDVMENFTKLTFLNLSRTNITNIDADAFHYQVKLHNLDLSHNRLTELKSDVFSKKLLHLTELILTANPLVAIDAITPKNLPKLGNFFLEGNGLQCNDLRRLQTWTRDTGLKLIFISSSNCNCTAMPPPVTTTEIMETTTQISEAAILKANRVTWQIALYAVLGSIICIGFIVLIIWLVRRKSTTKMVVPRIEQPNQPTLNNKRKDNRFTDDSDYEDIEMARPTSFNPVPINYPQIGPQQIITTPTAPALLAPPTYHQYATVNKRNSQISS